MATSLYKGFYLFHDEADQASFAISNFNNDANAHSYRLGESTNYDGSGTEINIVSQYNTARIHNSFGLFLETDATDLTYKYQYSDDGVAYTDLIASSSIDETKKVHFETAFDYADESIPSESHAWWRIQIANPSQAAIKIRQLAMGEGIFFERGFNQGIAVPGYDQSAKGIGMPERNGLPIGRKLYNRRVNFSARLRLLTPNSAATRSFWSNYNTKPVFVHWNMSAKYERPILLYRDVNKKPEKYDTFVTNDMILTGKGYV